MRYRSAKESSKKCNRRVDSFVHLESDGKYYLIINLTIKSQLLCSDYSHYNSYQEFLYNLCTSLKKKGLGCRKISYYLNHNGYKSARGKEIKNTSVYSILKKGKMRIDRLNQLKSHKDYGYTYDMKNTKDLDYFILMIKQKYDSLN